MNRSERKRRKPDGKPALLIESSDLNFPSSFIYAKEKMFMEKIPETPLEAAHSEHLAHSAASSNNPLSK